MHPAPRLPFTPHRPFAALLAAALTLTLATTASRELAAQSASPAEATAPVPAAAPAELISEIYPRYFSSYRNPLTRNSSLLLRFNDATDPAAIAAGAYLIDNQQQRLAVIARRPNAEQAAPLQRLDPTSEDGSDGQPIYPADHFVRIEPAKPLPLGREWKLVLPKQLASADGSHASRKDRVVKLGIIYPFTVSGSRTGNPYDSERYIEIRFNKALHPELSAEQLEAHFGLSPRPAKLRLSRSGSVLRVFGDFKLDQLYRINLQAGVPSHDQTRTASAYQAALNFKPAEPFVSMPAFAAPQLSSGARSFDINAGNLDALQIRIKQLDAKELIYALRGYQVYRSDRVIPFEMVPGRGIYSREFASPDASDRIQNVHLDWREVLGVSKSAANPDTESDDVSTAGSAAATPAALYICAEGGAKDDGDHRTFGAQSIIQLTDIGLAWKQDSSHTFVYAFSLAGGQPLANVALQLVDNEAETLRSATTDAHGIARLPRVDAIDGARWMMGSLGDDRHVMAIERLDATIGLWRFSVPYRYHRRNEQRHELGRRTYLFTDRPVYKPGEAVYLKSLTRLTNFDSLLPASADEGAKARLRVFDSRHRNILDTPVTVSEFGSLEHRFTLPEEGLGRYRIELDFNPPAADTDSDDDNSHSESPDRYDLKFDHYFQVAEYRPNTFEIQLSPPAQFTDQDLAQPIAGTIEIPVSADYYMGKPLSKARLQWHARLTPWQPQVKGLEKFSFRPLPNRDGRSRSSSFSHEFELAEDGSGTIEIELPAQGDNPSPLEVSLNAEITDINQQTVAASTRFVAHTAAHYFGIRTPQQTSREKQPAVFEIAAIDCSGSPLSDEAVGSELRIEKRVRFTVKVRSASGAIATRTRYRDELVHQAELDIATSAFNPETGAIRGTEYQFTPAESGNYRITVRGRDADGNATVAVEDFRVIGVDDRDWTYRDNLRLTLTPEKDRYLAGETARLFIDTPILGHALVSIERNKIRESFVMPITRNRDVIELPCPADGAPNLFVSVLVIRGAADSPHQHADTAFRLGYTQLKIDDPSREIQVELEPSQPEYQPGDAIEVVATVRDAEGKGLANTEVTLYAVDEGVLSLTGHRTPDPNAVLNAPWELDVATGQNLSTLLDEDPDEQHFNNKGYVVGGGGGGGGMSIERTRKDFKALAFWQGSLITDPQGRVQASFTAPDNLTDRIVAVAAKDDRFASTDAAIAINKPLIVEPALPAFANVGDHIDLRAVLHNNSDHKLTLDVSLELDATAEYRVDRLPPIIPARLTPSEPGADKSSASDSSRTRRIELAAGETSALTFPVRFVNVGTAHWIWRAVAANQRALSDSVESTLEVGFPLPLLRESHHTVVTRQAASETGANGDPELEDILSRISPHLLKGRGRISVTVSNSRLIEAQDALDYLLKYPYGCVEQTTSSTLPWLSTQNLRDALPALKKTDAEIADAILSGARRLLTMQTHDGGLGYWPGATEPVLWGSAYGGMALALAQRSGADLPGDQLDALWNYLSKNLRKTSEIKTPYDLSQRCLALYTLALAGKAEPSYHDLLYQRRNELPGEARALLALAMIESAPEDGDTSRARDLLADTAAPKSDVKWYGAPYSYATHILAWSQLEPHSDSANRLITGLLSLRKGERGWGSTYSNAWPILALSSHTRATLPDLAAANIEITLGSDRRSLEFDQRVASGETEFRFDGDLRGSKLTVQSGPAESGMALYAHVEIESLPDLDQVDAVNRGFDISRRYRKIAPNGDLSPATDLNIGDMVLVSLDMTIPEKQSYLAIDDPLPAIFEAVNPEFKTQANQEAPGTGDWRKRLYTHYSELRKDRALFFANYLYRGGDYQIQYLARVVAEGEATAPPAKIEAMYEPQRYGLSASERVSAQPLIPDADDERAAEARVAIR